MSSSRERVEWKNSLLENLARLDEEAADYIRRQRVSVGFWKQGPHTSAIWFPGKRILLNPKYFSIKTNPADPLIHSILIHEVRHLQQGFFTALSVYGELEAWQLGFRVYYGMTGFSYPPNLVELMSLPLGWDRAVLKRAQALMQLYAGNSYRSDLLPLYPLACEIKYWLGL